MYVTYRKVSVADEKMTCRQEAGWYRGIDMIVPLHVLCEGIFFVIGNSLEFPMTKKGTNVPMMRTRAKM